MKDRTFALLLLLIWLCLLPAQSAVSVLTQHNDNSRTGANLQETVLNTSNVNVHQFGKLFSRPVDGFLYAEPLYVPGVSIPGKGRHNVVYVATEHNSVYAFDADDPAASSPFWQVNLGPSVPSADLDGGPWGPYQDLIPEIGITGTPVIDAGTGTLYVVAKTKQNGVYALSLHALDITTGAERAHSPAPVTATVPGTGDGSVNGRITVDALKQLNRPGLLLLGSTVYVALGSHADFPPFHGWILGYQARTLAQTAVFITTPNGASGAIWQSGQGLAADGQGNIYCATGNGTFDADTGGSDYGNSILKLTPSPKGLTLADWFTPYNQADLSLADSDVGSSGPVLIPGIHRVVGGGKNKVLYVLDTGKMGHIHSGDDSQIVQRLQVAGGHIHGSPVFWQSPDGPRLYLWSENDISHVFKIDSGQLSVAAQGTITIPTGMPGAILSLSADKQKRGSGILWASHPFEGDANRVTRPGILRAFDASDVTKELWNSKQNETRDDVGNFAKFCPPMIANGKVYLATFSNQLDVYGLLPPPTAAK